MQITVRSHHVSITNALKDHAEAKLGKLDKFSSTLISVDVNLKVENSTSEDQQVVEVKMVLPGQTLYASETSRDLYASIDVVYDKCEKQLTKYKEKHHKHTDTQDSRGHGSSAGSSQDVMFIPKPMTPEDAAIAIEGRPFLMFRNSETMEINVIYHTGEGNELSLVEPH